MSMPMQRGASHARGPRHGPHPGARRTPTRPLHDSAGLGPQSRQGLAAKLAHQANESLRPLDRRLFAPTPFARPSPLFIVGVPRSGTTLTLQVLAHALRTTCIPRVLDHGYGLSNAVLRACRKRLQHPRPVFRSVRGRTPGLLSPGEGYGFWRRWFPQDADGAHFHRPQLSPGDAIDLQRAIHELQGHWQAPLLAKCVYLTFSITAIADAVPGARFLMVTRDPVSIAASLIRARRAIAARDWWSIRPPGYEHWLGKPPVEQVIWQVAETRRRCQEQLHALPANRWKKLAFEDLCNDPAAMVEDIGLWLSGAGHSRNEDCHLPEAFPLPPVPTEAEMAEMTGSPGYPRLLETT